MQLLVVEMLKNLDPCCLAPRSIRRNYCFSLKVYDEWWDNGKYEVSWECCEGWKKNFFGSSVGKGWWSIGRVIGFPLWSRVHYGGPSLVALHDGGDGEIFQKIGTFEVYNLFLFAFFKHACITCLPLILFVKRALQFYENLVMYVMKL